MSINEDNIYWISRYQSGTPDEQRDAYEKLININLPAINCIAKQYYRKNYSLKEDYIQEGIIGLLDGIKHYHPTKDIQPWTYIKFYVKNAIRMYMVNKEKVVRNPSYKYKQKNIKFTLDLDMAIGENKNRYEDNHYQQKLSIEDKYELEDKDELAAIDISEDNINLIRRHFVDGQTWEQIAAEDGRTDAHSARNQARNAIRRFRKAIATVPGNPAIDRLYKNRENSEENAYRS